ncbi:MAG: hypothetical protein AAFU64_03265 [Bacteroidota bacterium]
MKKLIFGLFSMALCLAMVSCDPDIVVFDSTGGSSVASFTSSGSAISITAQGPAAEITVGVTTSASSDRTYAISIDTNSSANANQYVLDGTFTIPAGEFNGTFTITPTFDSLPSDGSVVDLIINLEEVQNAQLDGIRNSFSLSMSKRCPIDGQFLGDYRVEQVAPGIFSSLTFGDGIVTLREGEGPNDRVFTAAPYTNLGSFSAIDFNFTLNCGAVIVAPDQRTGVGCGGSTFFGPPDVNGTFVDGDDSEVLVNITDDIDQNCGAPVQASFRLIKQ